MKFGVRDICDVVFKAKSDVQVGTKKFRAGQPVLYIDSAKTSTMEGAAATVYATGGKGNARLIAWEGEKTLTFTVEDALLSPIGFSVLSGAGLLGGKGATGEVHVHATAQAFCSAAGAIDLTDALEAGEEICKTAPIFVVTADTDGSIIGDLLKITEVDATTLTASTTADEELGTVAVPATGTNVFVDFYVVKQEENVSELQIDMENFAGNYYVEATTLFRRQLDGKDLPAEITFPNVKIQSNFTFNMAATGDPSTFTFTMDALPGYTYFNSKKKVLCAIQIIDDTIKVASSGESVFPHKDEADTTDAEIVEHDSYEEAGA